MRALVYEGVGKASVREVRRPRAPNGGVLLRISACAICGTDVKALTAGIASIKPPVVLGHELVGIVEELGEGTACFSPGERVSLATTLPCGICAMCRRGRTNLCLDKLPIGTHADGAFAEYLAVPARALEHGNLMRVPAGLPDEAATLAEPLGCVLNAQGLASVGFPDTVAVIGGGPLGLLNAEAARARGALKTILIQRSVPRAALARRFRVDHVVCSASTDPYAAVMELTGGLGADVVVNAAPSKEAVALALRLVAKAGRVSLFASVPKDDPELLIDVNRLHYAQLEIYGASDSRARDHEEALALLASGAISARELVTHTMGLEGFAEAVEAMRRREALKVVLKP